MTAATAAEFRIPLTGNQTVINRLDIRRRVLDALDRGQRAITLDLTRCGIIDAGALGILVTCAKLCRDRGGALVLERLTAYHKTLLAITKLDELLTIRSDPQ